jgi:hypothetical protein
MGLLDLLQSGNSGGGLLDFLRNNAMNQNLNQGMGQETAGYSPQTASLPMGAMAQTPQQIPSQDQPSPFDNAQWPVGPVGAPSQAMAQASQVAPQEPVQEPKSELGFWDKLNTGLQSVGNGGSIIGAMTGNRTDPAFLTEKKQQVSQQAIYDAVRQQPGMTKEKAFLIATNPKAFETYSTQLFDKKQYSFTKLDDGTIIRQDPLNGTVETAYQSTPKAEWGVVSKQDGQETYGWIDKNKRTTTIPAGQTSDRSDTITGPDGKQIVIPPGVDRKTFVNEVSRAGAKAAAGEKTEVQAKSEKFGNQMELSEKNTKDIVDQGTSYLGRASEGSDWLPGTAMAGRGLQTDNYQKYVQGRNSFITALLRDESGAAIGTSEFNRREKEMFPQPGDGPAVIKQKQELRRVAIDGMKKAAGPGYKSPEMNGGNASQGNGPAADPLGIR